VSKSLSVICYILSFICYLLFIIYLEGVFMDKTLELELARRNHDWWEMLALFFAHGKLFGDPMLRSVNGLRDADAARAWLGTLGRSVNVPMPLRPGDKNVKNYPFIFRNEVRVLFVKVTTVTVPGQVGLVTTKTELALYALPKKALQTPTQLAWNVVLVDASGNEILFNPSGMAQKGDWLYLIDGDTQKHIILGANEINGLVESERIRPAILPFDLGPGTPAALPANARGEAVGAGTGPDGTDYLVSLYSRPSNASQEPAYAPSILVRSIIDKDTGGLTYDTKVVNMGLNTTEFLIVPLESGAKHVVVSGIGGMLNEMFSNGSLSTIMSVPLAGDWPTEGTILFTGNPGTAGPRDLDINGLTGSLRMDNNGRMFLQTGRYGDNYGSYRYMLYETTTALLLNAPGCTLDEAVELGFLSVKDEGEVISPDLSPKTPTASTAGTFSRRRARMSGTTASGSSGVRNSS
jgi:hypothetical protein